MLYCKHTLHGNVGFSTSCLFLLTISSIDSFFIIYRDITCGHFFNVFSTRRDNRRFCIIFVHFSNIHCVGQRIWHILRQPHLWSKRLQLSVSPVLIKLWKKFWKPRQIVFYNESLRLFVSTGLAIIYTSFLIYTVTQVLHVFNMFCFALQSFTKRLSFSPPEL